MGQFTLLEFLLISIPEEFLIAFFAWAILGKKDTIKFRYVFVTGLITAVAFAVAQVLMYPNITLLVLPQLFAVTLILYFTYKLNFTEAIVGSLLTTVVLLIIQAAVLNVGLLITGYSLSDLSKNSLLRVAFFVPEFVIFGFISVLLYKYNIKVFNFKKKKISVFYFNRVRYVVLQLTFTFLIIIFNFRLYFFNEKLFVSNNDKALIILNLCLSVLFTIIIVRSAFKMGESIQKEEEQKREFDGREIIQNIEYLCKLMEANKYEEVSKILNSMKLEINSGIIDNLSTNRDNSIK